MGLSLERWSSVVHDRQAAASHRSVYWGPEELPRKELSLGYCWGTGEWTQLYLQKLGSFLERGSFKGKKLPKKRLWMAWAGGSGGAVPLTCPGPSLLHTRTSGDRENKMYEYKMEWSIVTHSVKSWGWKSSALRLPPSGTVYSPIGWEPWELRTSVTSPAGNSCTLGVRRWGTVPGDTVSAPAGSTRAGGALAAWRSTQRALPEHARKFLGGATERRPSCASR